jgi:hypothetical protein
MKCRLVQFAAILVLAAIPAGTVRAAEGEKVAVIQIKAIDGLDSRAANVEVTRDDRFAAGSRYHLNRSALSSIGGVKTLVLVERRADAMSGRDLVQKYTQEVVAVSGDQFTVKGIDGKDLTYTVEVLRDGSVDLIGPGDRIVVRDGRYQIWKVEKTALVDASRILID